MLARPRISRSVFALPVQIAIGVVVLLWLSFPQIARADLPVVDVPGGAISMDTTWTANNIYVVNGDVVVGENILLTIQPGTIVKFKPYTRLIINGALDARGASGSPTVFTSFQDDQYGGDTDGDGPASPPQKNDWGWIQFNDSSDDSRSFIQQAFIGYSGQDNIGCCDATHWGAITLVDAMPTLSGITFEQNNINGVGIPGGTKSASASVSSETWNNTEMVYVVIGDVTVAQGFQLNIAPGTIVKFTGYSRLIVQGALDARGTADTLITFTSLNDDQFGGDTDNDGADTPPQKNDWGWIQFDDSSDDSRSFIQNVRIRYSGVDNLGCCDATYQGAITLLNATPKLSNITFDQNFINGVAIPTITKSASTASSSETWDNTGVVYVVIGDVTVAQGFQLNIAPGMIVKFARHTRLIMQGSLDARGTPDLPITFTSLNDDEYGSDTDADGTDTPPQKNDWGWIEFDATSDDSRSFIQNARIRYSGVDNLGCCDATYRGAITLIDASPTLTNITFEQNYINGAFLPGGTKSAAPGVSSETWSNTDVVYVVGGNLVIAEGFQLNIAPGMVVKFDGTRLVIQGALTAQGTAEKPITFTSLLDDQVGGDTNGDGTGSAPKINDWDRIEFDASSDDANSVIAYAQVRYAGRILIQDASPRIMNSDISLNQRGFELRGNVQSVIEGNLIHNNVEQGIFTSNASPVIRQNRIYDNGTYGVFNETSTICVDATSNWWGSDTGPLDASNKADSCGLGANKGQGQTVTDNVNYRSWTGTSVTPPVSRALYLPLLTR